MLKFGCIKPFAFQKSLISRTLTILRDGCGENNNKVLCTALTLNMKNPDSPVPFCETNKRNLLKYQFPMFRISYDRNDVVEHAKAGEPMNISKSVN